MNNDYLYRAKEKVTDAKTLIVLASKRAAMLAGGARPMVKCKDDNFVDIALLEIAEGLLAPDYEAKTDDFMAQLAAAKAKAESEMPVKKQD
ncbi:MAG: DNA-directed RNA polymerase subunit omega [Lentisphaeria bacterium]|nr:DNA-directed RNA polymerase subunit omega [Lentisphaeria bacterium]MBO5759916.1 DNA-directed RNA polymerase subunit omega [Lentisphaeria bacterium]